MAIFVLIPRRLLLCRFGAAADCFAQSSGAPRRAFFPKAKKENIHQRSAGEKNYADLGFTRKRRDSFKMAVSDEDAAAKQVKKHNFFV